MKYSRDRICKLCLFFEDAQNLSISTGIDVSGIRFTTSTSPTVAVLASQSVLTDFVCLTDFLKNLFCFSLFFRGKVRFLNFFCKENNFFI